jgi:leucyl/phenylalanyl-tRNA---protein transferase
MKTVDLATKSKVEHDFSESLQARLLRWAAALAYALKPARIADIPFMFAGIIGSWIRRAPLVPVQPDLFGRPAGFAGLVHDDSIPTMLAAMCAGFYEQSHMGPRKWKSPLARAVVMLSDVHIPKRFRRTMKTLPYRVTIDQAFYETVLACAQPRRKLHVTWLHPRARRTFQELHNAGYAHSVEVWDQSGRLVGGVFGVSLGPVFAAFSMFHTANDASKLAIVSLYHHLQTWGFTAVDHQVMSPWVADLGGRNMSRDKFVTLLKGNGPESWGRWSAAFAAAETANWQPDIATVSATAPTISATAA